MLIIVLERNIQKCLFYCFIYWISFISTNNTYTNILNTLTMITTILVLINGIWTSVTI